MADFTEKEVYEAFGLGEQVQEPAVPAEGSDAETTKAGEKAQEIADPAQEAFEDTSAEGAESTADTAEPEEPEDQADTPAGESKEPLTPEQRRENAARRRQLQQKQAVDQAVSAAIEEERRKNEALMSEFFAKAGLKNTISGEPITNMEEFRIWNEAYEQARLNRELKSGKLTPEGLATAIGNHPIVKQAQALVAQDAQTKQAQASAAAKERVDREIEQIHEIDASINSVEDLFKAPYGQELYAMVKRGYSISDAHYLLNRDRLEKAKAEAVRQQSMNNARSKNHMNATGAPRGGGAISVPAADMALFRQFNPDATDAEIQAYYNNYMKT